MRLPIPLRRRWAAQPKLMRPVLQVLHRVCTRHLRGPAGLKPEAAASRAVTLIQRRGCGKARLDKKLGRRSIRQQSVKRNCNKSFTFNGFPYSG